jgi:photosystem II stability/assembly factor-like uncharacterized protein
MFIDSRATTFSFVPISEILFVNSSVGWICGDEGLLRTENGGHTWSKQEITRSGIGASRIRSDKVDLMSFLDARNGWVVSSSRMLKTLDGGLSWSEVRVPIESLDPAAEGTVTYRKVTSVTRDVVWVLALKELKGRFGSGPRYVLRTIDGGKRWEVLWRLDSDEPDVYFNLNSVDQHRGWLLGSKSVLVTYDGGRSWEKIAKVESGSLTDFSVVNGNECWAVGPHGTILHVRADGTSDTQNLGEQDHFQRVVFVDSIHGWIAGLGQRPNGMYESVLLATSDGGASWNVQYRDRPSWLNIFFVDANLGWLLVSEESLDKNKNGFKILQTQNGGKDWIVIFQRDSGTPWVPISKHQ